MKIYGPRSTNDDYFCNCSVAEGLILIPVWAFAVAACIVFAVRLFPFSGIHRVIGVVAGLAAILLPLATVWVIRTVTFPTIEELRGWALQYLTYLT